MSVKAPPFQRALNQGPSPNRLESRSKKALDKPLSLYYSFILVADIISTKINELL